MREMVVKGMILTVNYEEMLALNAGARAILGDGPVRTVVVAVPPEDRAAVEALPPIEGDLSVSTLHDLVGLEAGVSAIIGALRVEMDDRIVATHPASEPAVNSYFDYAHAMAVLGRIRELREDMEALIEIVTGQPVDAHAARHFVFPD